MGVHVPVYVGHWCLRVLVPVFVVVFYVCVHVLGFVLDILVSRVCC